MLHRFLPLATLIYVYVSLPAHAQAQQEAAGAVRDTAGAVNLISRGLHLNGLSITPRWAFMAPRPAH